MIDRFFSFEITLLLEICGNLHSNGRFLMDSFGEVVDLIDFSSILGSDDRFWVRDRFLIDFFRFLVRDRVFDDFSMIFVDLIDFG